MKCIIYGECLLGKQTQLIDGKIFSYLKGWTVFIYETSKKNYVTTSDCKSLIVRIIKTLQFLPAWEKQISS